MTYSVSVIDLEDKEKKTPFDSFISIHQVCNCLCLLVSAELDGGRRGPPVFRQRQISLNTGDEARDQSWL